MDFVPDGAELPTETIHGIPLPFRDIVSLEEDHSRRPMPPVRP
jgi:hypothetical protein